jgi:hypothetical protein
MISSSHGHHLVPVSDGGNGTAGVAEVICVVTKIVAVLAVSAVSAVFAVSAPFAVSAVFGDPVASELDDAAVTAWLALATVVTGVAMALTVTVVAATVDGAAGVFDPGFVGGADKDVPAIDAGVVDAS